MEKAKIEAKLQQQYQKYCALVAEMQAIPGIAVKVGNFAWSKTHTQEERKLALKWNGLAGKRFRLVRSMEVTLLKFEGIVTIKSVPGFSPSFAVADLEQNKSLDPAILEVLREERKRLAAREKQREADEIERNLREQRWAQERAQMEADYAKMPPEEKAILDNLVADALRTPEQIEADNKARAAEIAALNNEIAEGREGLRRISDEAGIIVREIRAAKAQYAELERERLFLESKIARERLDGEKDTDNPVVEDSDIAGFIAQGAGDKIPVLSPPAEERPKPVAPQDRVEINVPPCAKKKSAWQRFSDWLHKFWQ